MYTQNTKKQDSMLPLQLPAWMWTFKFTDLNSQQYQDAMNIMLATMLKLLYLALLACWYELKMQNVNGHMPSNPPLKTKLSQLVFHWRIYNWVHVTTHLLGF